MRTLLVALLLLTGPVYSFAQNNDTSTAFLKGSKDYAILEVQSLALNSDRIVFYSNFTSENLEKKFEKIKQYRDANYDGRLMICFKYLDSLGYDLVTSRGFYNSEFSSGEYIFVKQSH